MHAVTEVSRLYHLPRNRQIVSMTPLKIRAYPYVCYSSEAQKEGASVARQLEMARAYAATRKDIILDESLQSD